MSETSNVHFFTYQGLQWGVSQLKLKDSPQIQILGVQDKDGAWGKEFIKDPYETMHHIHQDQYLPLIVSSVLRESVCDLQPDVTITDGKATFGFRPIYSKDANCILPFYDNIPSFPGSMWDTAQHIAGWVKRDDEERDSTDDILWHGIDRAARSLKITTSEIYISATLSASAIALGDVIDVVYVVDMQDPDYPASYFKNDEYYRSMLVDATSAWKALVCLYVYKKYREDIKKNPEVRKARQILISEDVVDNRYVRIQVRYIMRSGFGCDFIDVYTDEDMKNIQPNLHYLYLASTDDEQLPVGKNYLCNLKQLFASHMLMSHPLVRAWGIVSHIPTAKDRIQVNGEDGVPIDLDAPDGLIIYSRKTPDMDNDMTGMNVLGLMMSKIHGNVCFVDQLNPVKSWWRKRRFPYGKILNPEFYVPEDLEKVFRESWEEFHSPEFANNPANAEIVKKYTTYESYRNAYPEKFGSHDWTKRVVEICSFVVNYDGWKENIVSFDTHKPRFWMLHRFCVEYCRYWRKKGYDFIFLNAVTPDSMHFLINDGIDPFTDFRYSLLIYDPKGLPKHVDKDFIDEGGHVMWTQDSVHG